MHAREETKNTATFDEIRSGNLAVRIARSEKEIEAAQMLRYRVFYDEMGCSASEEVQAKKRDFDGFDVYCDHLLVLDYDLPASGSQVVATYRLLRRSQMQKHLKAFYSEDEFNIAAIKNEKGEILELGRSCVDANYRNRSAMQLLWRGIGAYVTQYDIKLMFGCASFFGTDVKEHAVPLSYLYHYHLAPQGIRAVALPERYVEMNLVPKEEINVKRAFAALPSLIKGYLRLNGYIGLGAVIDSHFNTVDVGIVVQTDLVADKYAQRYSTPGAKS